MKFVSQRCRHFTQHKGKKTFNKEQLSPFSFIVTKVSLSLSYFDLITPVGRLLEKHCIARKMSGTDHSE